MPTLGELQAAGYHGVHLYCRDCRRITIRWWSHFPLPPETDFAAMTRRLRCRTCRTRPNAEDVEPYYHDTARAHGRSTPPQPIEPPSGSNEDADDGPAEHPT